MVLFAISDAKEIIRLEGVDLRCERMLEGGAKFPGIIDLKHDNNYYDISQGFYHKLGEGTNMSIDSIGSLQTSNSGGSVAMSIDNSSEGSNDSHTRILSHSRKSRNHFILFL